MPEVKLDLHTHSIISYDGGITIEGFRSLLADPALTVAITDHNEISFSAGLQKEFPNQIIIGEEILTLEGEIIGLFLQSRIDPNQTLHETIRQIKEQNGLVYVPHPGEISRKGLSLSTLEKIAGSTDIVEVFNARSKEPWQSQKTVQLAARLGIPAAASSDAHGMGGLGSAFTIVDALPTRENLLSLLADGRMQKKHAPLWSYLDPMRNKLKKLLP